MLIRRLAHSLRQVAELQPQPAVSTVDTDMEAEVVSSVETEELVRAWEEEQRRAAQRLAELRAAREAELEAQRREQERLAKEQVRARACVHQRAT